MRNILLAAAIVLGLSGMAFAGGKEGVTIKTDKRRYESSCEAGQMSLVITNNSPDTVYLSDLSFEEVDMSVGFHWERQENAMHDIRPYLKTRLVKGESVKEIIKPSFLFYQVCPVGARKYRIVATIYSQCPGIGPKFFPDGCAASKKIYSNEFVVRWEKKK